MIIITIIIIVIVIIIISIIIVMVITMVLVIVLLPSMLLHTDKPKSDTTQSENSAKRCRSNPVPALQTKIAGVDGLSSQSTRSAGVNGWLSQSHAASPHNHALYGPVSHRPWYQWLSGWASAAGGCCTTWVASTGHAKKPRNVDHGNLTIISVLQCVQYIIRWLFIYVYSNIMCVCNVM